MSESNKHLFWDSKPVVVLQKNNETALTLVQEQHGFIQPSLSSSLEWHIEYHITEESLTKMHQFLEKHYITAEYQYQIMYSLAHFQHELIYDKAIIVSIRSKKTGDTVGMICGSVHRFIYNGEEIPDILFINFLCVQQSLRHLGLAPKLITEISRQANYTWGIQRAYYTSFTELPTPFSETHCYHRIINPVRCMEAEYYTPSSKKEIQMLMRYIPLQKRKYTFLWVDENMNWSGIHDATKIATIVSDYYKRSKHLYEDITASFIQSICDKSCFDKCFIYKNNTLIGFISVIHHPYRIIKWNNFDSKKYLKTVSLYHYGLIEEEDINIEYIFKECITSVQELCRWDLFITHDKNITSEYFTQWNHYYHYMYNMKMPILSSDKIGIIGL